jgi:molecular chaperone GrpE
VAENESAQTDAVDEPEMPREAVEKPSIEIASGDDLVVDSIPRAEGEDLRAELDEARDRALRTQAELENYRKRIARQMDEERRYAQLPLMRDLLHVQDNMGRAIEAAENADRTESLLEGFKMVIRELEDVLVRHHCTEIEADGKPFDPHLHEAILQQPSDEHPPGTVVQVVRAGFQLHDRVIRPTQVIVSAAIPQDRGQEAPDPN